MNKISQKLYTLLVLSVGLSVIISSLSITAYLLFQIEKDNYEKDLIYLDGLADSMERFLEHGVTLNYQLSINPDIKQTILEKKEWELRYTSYEETYDTAGELNDNSGFPLLTQTQQRYSFVELFFLQDDKGEQTSRSFGNLAKREERWWFKRIAEGGDYRPFISQSYFSLTGDKPVASIFHPVMNRDEFIGILGMDINFQHLQNLINRYVNSSDLYAIVLDMNGVIIAHPDTKKINEIYNLIDMTYSSLNAETAGILNNDGFLNQQKLPLNWPDGISKAAAAAVRGEKGVVKNISVEGEKSNLYFAPIPLFPEGNSGQNYAVLLVHKQSGLLFARNIIFLSVFLFIIVIIAILFFFFSRLYKKNILIPLNRLVHSMGQTEEDHFTEINLETGDEFLLLANAYNDLRIKLKTANSQLVEKLEFLNESEASYKAFADVGLALSTEKNIYNLMEVILNEALNLTNADGGTLYLYDSERQQLKFAILHTETMNLHMSESSGEPLPFPPVPLYDNQGNPNHSNVSSHAALTGQVSNIPDVYSADKFDFKGTRDYDIRNGYRSQSMLVIPMKNMDDELIGVIQLINARNKEGGSVIPFPEVNENLILSLASQAAVALTNVELQKNLEVLFHSFIKSIATAIDEKSAFTGGHIRRVVTLTMMIAEEINKDESDAFAETFFSLEEMEELRISAWMHDIGKITTPEYLIDKETKLQSFLDGMDLIEMRYQLLIEVNEQKNSKISSTLSPEELELDLEFLKRCNKPGEYLSDEKMEKLSQIYNKTYSMGKVKIPFLSHDEFAALSIRKGSLDAEERNIIEHHAEMSRRILKELPFPKHLANVGVYASMHHEKLDGSGYPDGVSGDLIPLQARIIAVADIFEALTAKDRPYRDPIKLSKAYQIMQLMVKDGHIDGRILQLMAHSGIIYRYATSELTEDQIDDMSFV